MGKTRTKKMMGKSDHDKIIIDRNTEQLIDLLSEGKMSQKEIAAMYAVRTDSIGRFKTKHLEEIRERKQKIEYEKPEVFITPREKFWCDKDQSALIVIEAQTDVEKTEREKRIEYLLGLENPNKTDICELVLLEKINNGEKINFRAIMREVGMKSSSNVDRCIRVRNINIPDELREFHNSKKFDPLEEITEDWDPLNDIEESAPVKAENLITMDELEKMCEEPKKGSIISCSLFAGRHEIPDDINLSIFSTVAMPSDKMFDFEYQTQVVNDFIDKYVPEKSTIRCYTSGLNVANNSLITTCLSRKINLIIMNYDLDINAYRSQVVIDMFDGPLKSNQDIKEYFEKLYSNTTVEMEISDITNTQFAIREIFYGKKSLTNKYSSIREAKVFVTDNKIKAIEKYLEVNADIYSEDNIDQAICMLGHEYKMDSCGKWQQSNCFGIVRNYCTGG